MPKMFEFLSDSDQQKLEGVKESVATQLVKESTQRKPRPGTIIKFVPDQLYERRINELKISIPALARVWFQERKIDDDLAKAAWKTIVDQERDWAADWFITTQPRHRIGESFYFGIVIREIHLPIFFKEFGDETDEYWSRYVTIITETWKRILDVEGRFQPIRKSPKVIKFNAKRLRDLGIEGNIEVIEEAGIERLRLSGSITESTNNEISAKVDMVSLKGLLNRLKRR